MSGAEIKLGVIFAIILLTSLIGGALVIHGTINKTKWGINFKGVKCPKCRKKLYAPIKKNWAGGYSKESLWAICTCAKCGIVTDNWGRQIGSFKVEP